AEPGVVAKALDEAQPLEVVLVVEPVVALRPCGRLEQPELLVVAKRAGRQAERGAHLLDSEERRGRAVDFRACGGVEVAHESRILPYLAVYVKVSVRAHALERST